MAEYTIPHQAGNTFAQDALVYAQEHPGTSYANGDIGHYDTTEGYGHGQYIYEQGTWNIYVPFTVLPSISFETVVPGSAFDVRTKINSNFGQIDTQASTVQTNINALASAISDAGKTGLAADINTDSAFQFTSQTEKDLWNKRMTATTSGAFTIKQDGTDITEDIQDLLNAQIPTKLGDLNNDIGYVVNTSGEAYVVAENNSPAIIYDTDVSATFIEDPEQTYIHVDPDLKYKGTVTLSGTTSSMIPTVIFNQAEAISRNYAQICDSDTDCIHIWSKVNTPITVKLAMATTPVTSV